MKRLAAIDIGTNSALLLVAEVTDSGDIRPLFDFEKIIRLGEGVDANKILQQPAMERAVNTVKEYAAIAKEYNVAEIVLSGTSAVRDAKNRDDLLARIADNTGVYMRVLTGEEEARLTYLGALSNKSNPWGDLLMLDIGGGSTEFIWGNKTEITRAISLNVGSVRLRERLQKHDPITSEEFYSIETTITESIKSETGIDSTSKPDFFVAIAGTVTTLAAMHLGLEKYEPGKVDGMRLFLSDIKKLIEIFKRSTSEEIGVMPGINPARASVILPGAMILQAVMQFIGFNEVIVSDRGLRYGLVIDKIKNELSV